MKHKRMTADERRGQIADAATKLFAKHGFSGVTTRQIANAAKVNEALLYRYFPNKESLYSAIIERKLDDQGALLDPEMLEGEDDFRILKYIIGTFMARIGEDKSFMRLMLFSGLEDHRLSTKFLERRVGEVMPHVAGYFERRMKRGAFRKVDTRVVIRALIGMVMHYILTTDLFKLPEAMRMSEKEAVDGFGKIILEGVRVK